MTSLRADDPRAVELVAAIRGGDVERLRKRLAEDTELATARIVDAQGVLARRGNDVGRASATGRRFYVLR